VEANNLIVTSSPSFFLCAARIEMETGKKISKKASIEKEEMSLRAGGIERS
jgi:hypothetical protein